MNKMSKKVNMNMFQSIKTALEKSEDKGSGLYKELLKTPVGNTFIVKLLPYAEDPSKTFFHYYNQGWESYATGQYIQALSPTTFGERDPISEARFKALRGTDIELKEKFDKVRRSEKWLVNVLVIDDPVNPENNGQVKILRYGKQLGTIIDNAISGEDADEYGLRVFEMSPNGVNLRIKVEKQGDFPSYVTSRFVGSNPLDLSDDKQSEILDSCHPLEEVFTSKTYDELVEMMNEHIYVKSSDTEMTEKDDEAIADVIESVQGTSTPVKEAEVKHTPDVAEQEAEIDDLLDGLEI